MRLHLHNTATVSVLEQGEKKVKDLVVGDKVLVSEDGIEFSLTPILDIHYEDYDKWSKLTFNGREAVFDREGVYNTNLSILDEEIVNYTTKDYSRVSKASVLELEGNPTYLFVNDIGTLYAKEESSC